MIIIPMQWLWISIVVVFINMKYWSEPLVGGETQPTNIINSETFRNIKILWDGNNKTKTRSSVASYGGLMGNSARNESIFQ